MEKTLGIKYILELESVVLVLAGGEILKYSIADKTCESVGCIESGILGFSCSPNQELIVVATGTNMLISFDTNFDVRGEVHIDESPEIFSSPSTPQTVYFAWKADAKVSLLRV